MRRPLVVAVTTRTPAFLGTVRPIVGLLCAVLIPATAAAQRADRHPCFLYAQTLREVERETPNEIRERLRFMYVAARGMSTLEPATANLLKAASAKRGIADAGRQMADACRAVGQWTFPDIQPGATGPVREADAIRQLQAVLERPSATPRVR